MKAVGAFVRKRTRSAKDWVNGRIESAFSKLMAGYVDEFLQSSLGTSILADAIRVRSRTLSDENPEIGQLLKINERNGSQRRHKQFKTVARALKRGNVLLVGPPGCGKTTIAKQIAEMRGEELYFSGPVQSEYKLLGFKDATGVYQETQFFQAYSRGGVFLFDELDACSPQVLVAFNTAIDNDICDFPLGGGAQRRHDRFLCLAAANTHGRGNRLNFHGRNPLDATTLDRFILIDIDYDEGLEFAQAGNDDWVRIVQAWRKAAQKEVPEHFISMRASIVGARLLKEKFPQSDVEKMVVWRGLDQHRRSLIKDSAVRSGT